MINYSYTCFSNSCGSINHRKNTTFEGKIKKSFEHGCLLYNLRNLPLNRQLRQAISFKENYGESTASKLLLKKFMSGSPLLSLKCTESQKD